MLKGSPMRCSVLSKCGDLAHLLYMVLRLSESQASHGRDALSHRVALGYGQPLEARWEAGGSHARHSPDWNPSSCFCWRLPA